MRLVFAFLTKGGINQPAIWREFFAHANRKHFAILVHASSGKFDADFGVPHTVVPTEPTTWEKTINAHYSFYKAYLNVPHAAKLVVLSESCIPIAPFAHVYQTLMGDLSKSYFNELKAPWWSAHSRKTARMLHPHLMGHEQWTCLTDTHISLLLKHEIMIKKAFSQCFADNESFSGTCIRMHEGQQNMLRNDYHFIERNPRSPQPPTTFYELNDAQVMHLRQRGFIFARKFHVGSDVTNLIPLVKP